MAPPVTLNNGFTVTVEDSEGGTQTYEVNSSFTFERNKYYNLKREVKIEDNVQDNSIPNNQIWYTSSDNQVITPYKTDIFGANIVSNTYKNGKGIITFEGDISQIGDYAFASKTNLTSITIPNSITSIGKRAFRDCI